MTSVEFSVNVQNVPEGWRVAVVGSSRSIGMWKPHRAKDLEDKGSGIWAGTVRFEPDEYVYSLEYKYILLGARGHQETWLPGSNLRIKAPELIEVKDEDWVLPENLPPSTEAAPEVKSAPAPPTSNDKPKSYTAPPKAPPPNPAVTSVKVGDQKDFNGVPAWYSDSVFYLIYCLGTPGYGGGGFFGDCPDVNDQLSEPVPRLLRLRNWYDYMSELGVNAVYFTPIFDSGTHGYDTYDYFRIDRRLGDLTDFKAVLSELHERGIRVVLDGVFNHTGRGHFAFSDIISRGKDWRNSPYKDWYFLKDGRSSYGDKFDYEAWSGYQVLPKLNVDNPEVRNHIFDVARFWLELGIDGWRLDCASDIKPDFWVEFRKVCTEARADSVLIGEIIHGDYNEWVDGKTCLHSATNYQLYKPIWSALKDKNFFELRHNAERDETVYGSKLLMTFLGNHDVDRIFSILNNDRRLMLLANLLMLTLKGVPCLYYGDECFMTGEKRHGGDAALRGPMLLPDDESWDRTLFHALRKLVDLRHKYASLRQGKLVLHWNSNEAMVYHRQFDNEIVAIAANCGNKPCTVEMGIRAASAEEYVWDASQETPNPVEGSDPTRVVLPPLGARIFVKNA